MSTRDRVFVLFLIFTSLFYGCGERYEELNRDPNNSVSVKPEVLLTYGIESAVDRYWGHRNRYERLNLDGGMLWMQYLARNTYVDEGDNYSVTPTLYTKTWSGFYTDALANFNRIVVLTQPGGEYENRNYEGMARVMRSWVFSLLTETYGAIPYEEALKGTANNPVYTPKYDSQEKVYEGLLEDLREANELLDESGQPVWGDILFGGDILLWKKFANSLRLKLANRQAAKKPMESSAIFLEILSDPAHYPIMESNADNILLQNGNSMSSANEWYNVMVVAGRTDYNMSSTLVDELIRLNDPRLTVFANPTDSGQYVGQPNGLPDLLAISYATTSSPVGNHFIQPGTPSMIMGYPELLFILAEAAFDGDYTEGESAEAYFSEAVTASFLQYNLEIPPGYLSELGPLDKELIMTQKWIALFGQGIEAWTEYRRTGFPKLPPPHPDALFANDGVLPTRLTYPTTEYSLNAESVKEGILLNGGEDNMKTELWFKE